MRGNLKETCETTICVFGFQSKRAKPKPQQVTGEHGITEEGQVTACDFEGSQSGSAQGVKGTRLFLLPRLSKSLCERVITTSLLCTRADADIGGGVLTGLYQTSRCAFHPAAVNGLVTKPKKGSITRPLRPQG